MRFGIIIAGTLNRNSASNRSFSHGDLNVARALGSNRQSGFTIIEVMLVVTIIGVLAAIMLPSARENALRAKISEAILAFGHCKNAVTEVYLTGDSMPADGDWGCESSTSTSQYVARIATTKGNGTIKITLQGIDLRVNTFDITLAPLDSSGNLMTEVGMGVSRWRCGYPGDGTDLNQKYLPGSCRGI